MISSRERISNNIKFSEELVRQLINNKFNVIRAKYTNSTGRIVRINIGQIFEESLIPVSGRVFVKLGSEKERISHHLMEEQYLEFRFEYPHPYKYCKKITSSERKVFLDDWSVFRIVDCIKDHVSDESLKMELTEKIVDPRHKKDIYIEKKKAELKKNITDIKKWFSDLFPKDKYYEDY